MERNHTYRGVNFLYRFYLASHDGLAKINTLTPAPFRAFVPLMSWYAAVTESETGDYEAEATERVIATATAYTVHLTKWSDLPTREALATRGTFWDMDYDAGKIVMIHTPPPGPKEANPTFWAVHDMVEEFGKYVEPLRDMPLGAVPAAFQANHVGVTKDHIVVSCESRVVWTDIETKAHCITDACEGSLAALPLGTSPPVAPERGLPAGSEGVCILLTRGARRQRRGECHHAPNDRVCGDADGAWVSGQDHVQRSPDFGHGDARAQSTAPAGDEGRRVRPPRGPTRDDAGGHQGGAHHRAHL